MAYEEKIQQLSRRLRKCQNMVPLIGDLSGTERLKNYTMELETQLSQHMAAAERPAIEGEAIAARHDRTCCDIAHSATPLPKEYAASVRGFRSGSDAIVFW